MANQTNEIWIEMGQFSSHGILLSMYDINKLKEGDLVKVSRPSDEIEECTIHQSEIGELYAVPNSTWWT